MPLSAGHRRPLNGIDAAGEINEIQQRISDWADSGFINAEHLLALLRRQQRNASGYPKIRPTDCMRVTDAFREIYEKNIAYFRTCDPIIVSDFDRIIEAAIATDIQFYPNEVLKLRVLQAESKFERGDAEGILRAIEIYAVRPYLLEGNFKEIKALFRLDSEARIMLGRDDNFCSMTFFRIRFLSSLWPHKAWSIAHAFIRFIALSGPTDRFDQKLFVSLSRISLNSAKWNRSIASPISGLIQIIIQVILGSLLFLESHLSRTAKIKTNETASRVLVTRAMGGVGDLLMMTPAFRALALRYARPVTLAVPQQFFPVFANNPHVETVDIHGDPIAISDFDQWHNFTRCPASRYESRRLPKIKKGRVELFAHGAGIAPKELKKSGLDLELHLDPEQIAFRDKFIDDLGFNREKLIGVQPYSREVYREYPRMMDVIRHLAENFDLIIFHNSPENIPKGSRIATTAGLSLRQSFALVSALKLMVSIDSAFIHAAAAFNVPVIGLFGPTDGRIRTQHHGDAEIIQLDDKFPCISCWRNEDEPCYVTGSTGVSPCLSAIEETSITNAVARFFHQP